MKPTGQQAFEAADAAMAGLVAWGVRDCCTAASAAFDALWGIDPMGRLRGAYASEDEALRLVVAAGGFLPLVRRQAAEAGLLRREDRALPGDLGVVVTRDERGAERPSLALCFGEGWAVKGKRGVAVVHAAVEVFRAP